MVNNRREYVGSRSIFYVVLIVILLISVHIPGISGSDLSQTTGDNSSPSLSMGESIEGEIQEPLGVGIFWWKKGDPALDNTRLDTQGFANYMASKGFSKDFEVCEYDLTKYKFTDRLFGEDQDYLEQTDFVYYAGHGYHHVIMVDKEYNPFTSYAYYSECSWGDEGPVKWIGLASCNNTENEFKVAMNGINMILGWSTWCDDKQFGETLAKHCTDDKMSIKESWFTTAIEKSTTRNLEAKIMGENSAVGDDCIYAGGEYEEDVEVTNQITYWKCPVNHFPNIYGIPTGGETTEESSSTSTQGSSASSTTGSTLNVRGDTSSGFSYDSPSLDSYDEVSDDIYNQVDSEEVYYIETDDISLAFPTILISEEEVYSSEAPDLSYEKANWKTMAKKYMLDKGLLTDEDEEYVNYYMLMVPQKQGFSYKRDGLFLDQDEYFEEWDIALNVFIIKKLDGDIELPPIPDDENVLIEGSEESSTSTTYLRADIEQETSEETENSVSGDLYQKTTIVISQGKTIGYSFTRTGLYNDDEFDTGGDNEP
jgi:hypothetical protein